MLIYEQNGACQGNVLIFKADFVKNKLPSSANLKEMRRRNNWDREREATKGVVVASCLLWQ